MLRTLLCQRVNMGYDACTVDSTSVILTGSARVNSLSLPQAQALNR